jgi:putative transcriptional regulator
MSQSSEILDAVHETARALHDADIMEPTTMQAFDGLCLTPPREYTDAELKAMRSKLRVSQPVLATFLGATQSTVARWEQGTRKPRGPALRLLSILDRKGLDAIA